MSRESFLANVEDATACVITLSEHIDEEVFLRAQQLKVIANMAVGFDNIDISLAKKHGVVVTNTSRTDRDNCRTRVYIDAY